MNNNKNISTKREITANVKDILLNERKYLLIIHLRNANIQDT